MPPGGARARRAMRHKLPNDDEACAPTAAARRPRDAAPEELRLPQILQAQRQAEPKVSRRAARSQRGGATGPAVLWVEASLADHRRAGKPLPNDRQAQFATDLAAMHAGLQRAGVEVASFIDESGALGWATHNSTRVVCACLQIEPRDAIRNSVGVVDMVQRYTARGVPVLLVQLTSDSPSAAEAEAVRVCKIICNDERIVLCLDSSTAQLATMELVAQSYAFIDGRLQRVSNPALNPADAAASDAEEVGEAEPAYFHAMGVSHPHAACRRVRVLGRF